jgi:hypothetical protein
MAHWTRPLRDGGVEFYMRANGQTMKGSAGSHATYRDLRGMFETWTGCTLPAPEEKLARGARRKGTPDG